MLLQRYQKEREDCCPYGTEGVGKGGQRDEGAVARIHERQSNVCLLGCGPLCILRGFLKLLSLWCLGTSDLPSPCLCPSTVCLGPLLPLLCSAPASPSCACTPLLAARFIKKNQVCLHGNRETAEKWQLNAAAPHLISTLALTEQIMGNNTPLCCGEMKCFSRRLSCCRDLFVTVPAKISLLFCLSLFLIPSSFSPSFPFLPVVSTWPFCFHLFLCIPSFLFFSFPHLFSHLLSLSCSLVLLFLVLKISVSEAQGFCGALSFLHLSDFPCSS